jgi:retinol dehydrogenase-12
MDGQGTGAALECQERHVELRRTQALLEHNAKVYIAGRDSKKAAAAIQSLKQETGKEALFLKVDLANLADVKAAANTFLRCAFPPAQILQSRWQHSSQENELAILFNNAGVMTPPMTQFTTDGYDMQVGDI